MRFHMGACWRCGVNPGFICFNQTEEWTRLNSFQAGFASVSEEARFKIEARRPNPAPHVILSGHLLVRTGEKTRLEHTHFKTLGSL